MPSVVRPVAWGADQRQQFLDWISLELYNAIGQRQVLERRWRSWLELYRAPADQPKKRFPFEGASNLMLPLMATAVDQLHAKFMQTLHASDALWSIEPLNEAWVTTAKPMQDFLELLDKRVLKMYDVDNRAVLEMVKMGTAIYKTHWHYEDRMVSSFSPDGPKRIRKIRSRPVVDHVRLHDFLVPPTALSINVEDQGGAPWVAERMRFHPSRLQQLAEATAPILPNMGKEEVDRIVSFQLRFPTEYAQKVQQLDYLKHAFTTSSTDFDKVTESETPRGISGTVVKEVELWEIHARVETQPNVWDDIVCWFHLPTRTLLRDIYADYPHEGRPYDKIVYFPGEGFYGIGVCEQLEMFQKSGSDIFNFQIDNMLLGNSIGIAAKGGSNIGPGEPIYPGMVKITDGDPRQEFMPFKLGDINAGIPNTFAQILQLGKERSGQGDLQNGQIDALPSRTPATTVMSLLQEGSKRPDLTLKGMRNQGLSAVGMKVLQLLQYHIGMPEDKGAQTYLRFATDALGMQGSMVAQKLQTPLEDVELGLAVQLAATAQGANKDLEKQNYQQLMATGMQVANTIIGWYGAAAQAPAMMPTIQQAASGLLELFTRYVEQFDVRNIEKIVPQVEATVAAGVPAPLGAIQGAGAGNPIPDQLAALAALGSGAGAPVG